MPALSTQAHTGCAVPGQKSDVQGKRTNKSKREQRKRKHDLRYLLTTRTSVRGITSVCMHYSTHISLRKNDPSTVCSAKTQIYVPFFSSSSFPPAQRIRQISSDRKGLMEKEKKEKKTPKRVRAEGAEKIEEERGRKSKFKG